MILWSFIFLQHEIKYGMFHFMKCIFDDIVKIEKERIDDRKQQEHA